MVGENKHQPRGGGTERENREKIPTTGEEHIVVGGKTIITGDEHTVVGGKTLITGRRRTFEVL